MALSGQTLRSIHQWQFFGLDLHRQVWFHHGTQAVTGGIDGQKLTQQFNRFLLMEPLILDKMFR